MSTTLVPPRATPTPAVYWQAVRAYSFPASLVSVFLGTALAVRASGMHFYSGHFFLVLMGALLAHASANVWNDYFDFRNGVDTKPEHGSGVLTSQLLTSSQMLRFGLILSLSAVACGLGLLAVLPLHTPVTGVVSLVGIGIACAVLYPLFLKQFALGDPLIVLSFGLGLPLGAFLAQSTRWDAPAIGFVLGVSVPVALLVDGILHANNMRDRADDRAAGVHTLATLFSEATGERLLGALLFLPIVLTFLGVISGWLSAGSLFVFIAVPALLRAYRERSVPGTAKAHLLFGAVYALTALFCHFPPV